MIDMHVSRRDRRTLAVGLVSVSTMLSVGRGLPALRQWERARVAEAVTTREAVQTADNSIRTIARLRDSLKARVAMLEVARAALVKGVTPEGAAAMLAQRVERMAGEQEVQILTVTLLPDTIVRMGFARVAIRIGAESDVAGILNLLYEIESDKSPLTVRELAINQPDPMAPSSKPDVLRVDLAVQTLARIEPGPQPRKPVR